MADEFAAPSNHREDLLRVCGQYEHDPSPVTRHDANIGAALGAHPAPLPALQQHWGNKEQAELYRIQTEDAWGRWLWLVAELVPTGGTMRAPHSPSIGFKGFLVHADVLPLRKCQKGRPMGCSACETSCSVEPATSTSLQQ